MYLLYFVLLDALLGNLTHVKANDFNLIVLMKSVSRGDNWTGNGQGCGCEE